MDDEDYTYVRHLPPQTGPDLLHAELDALREQVVKLADLVTRLDTRLQTLERQVRKPAVGGVVSTVDWEDNL